MLYPLGATSSLLRCRYSFRADCSLRMRNERKLASFGAFEEQPSCITPSHTWISGQEVCVE